MNTRPSFIYRQPRIPNSAYWLVATRVLPHMLCSKSPFRFQDVFCEDPGRLSEKLAVEIIPRRAGKNIITGSRLTAMSDPAGSYFRKRFPSHTYQENIRSKRFPRTLSARGPGGVGVWDAAQCYNPTNKQKNGDVLLLFKIIKRTIRQP